MTDEIIEEIRRQDQLTKEAFLKGVPSEIVAKAGLEDQKRKTMDEDQRIRWNKMVVENERLKKELAAEQSAVRALKTVCELTTIERNKLRERLARATNPLTTKR